MQIIDKYKLIRDVQYRKKAYDMVFKELDELKRLNAIQEEYQDPMFRNKFIENISVFLFITIS